MLLLLLIEQDVALDLLGSSIGRTKEIALAISDEVGKYTASIFVRYISIFLVFILSEKYY